MNRLTSVVTGLMLFSVSAAAQTPAAGQKLTLTASMQSAYKATKENLTKAAQTMPDEGYAFKPGTHKDLRTFGALIGHQADNQFIHCSTLKGVPNPKPAQANEKMAMKATKAEMVKALGDAFAFCDSAISSLTDQNALQMIKSPEGETARAAVVSTLLAHGHGSENVAAVYLAAKGIARPW